MKLLVIGAGSIGQRHACNAAPLAEVAVYDRDNDLAQKTAQIAGATALASEQDAWNWGADGIIIATPHKTHIPVAMSALETGAQVLVEKPISDSLKGVSDLIQAYHAKQRKLFIVTNMRFHPAIAAMHDALKKIGRVLYARAQYGNYLPAMRPQVDYRTLYAGKRSEGGGVILDAIHEVDYLRWFFGPVSSVTASAGKLSDMDIDVEDYAALNLEHVSGSRTEIHLDYLQQCKQRGCEIIGTDGTILWRSEGKAPEHCQVRLFEKSSGTWSTLFESDDLDNGLSYITLMEEFAKSIRGEVTALAPAEDGQAALEIALSALASAQSGHTHRL